HWTFETIPIDIKTSQTNICNSKSAFTGGIINKITRHKKFDKLQLHRIFGHPSPEVIDHIADAAREGTITVLETKPSPKSIKCETCALSKAHQKISRISDKEHPQTKPFERITLDLIPMREGFNSNTQIIHFQCAKTLFNMIFTMYTKSESLKYTRKTLKMIKSIGHQETYDDEFNLPGVFPDETQTYTSSQKSTKGYVYIDDSKSQKPTQHAMEGNRELAKARNNHARNAALINPDIDPRNILSKRTRNSSKMSQFAQYHSSFSSAIVKTKNWTKLTREELPPAPKGWEQMLRHQFSAEFLKAAEKEPRSSSSPRS
ncbi:hypothetical protein HI914_03230, partial [Erysiphe necator]